MSPSIVDPDDVYVSLLETKNLSSTEALNILNHLYQIFYQRPYNETERQTFESVLTQYGFQGIAYVTYKIATSDDRMNKAKQWMTELWQKNLSRNPYPSEFEQNIEKIAFAGELVISTLEIDINVSEKLRCKAKQALDNGQYQEAKAILERALTDGIPSWKVWHEYGLLLKRLDKHEEALLMYEKAIYKNELDNNWNWSCLDALDCFKVLAKKDKNFLYKGYEFFKAIADKFPQRPSGFHCYAWCSWKIGNQQEACEAYKNAILCNHQTDERLISWSCYDLLEQYKFMGAQNEAITFFNEISQKRPFMWAFWHCLGQLELNYNNNPSKAIGYYDLAISNHPNKEKADKWSYYDKAIAFFRLDKFEEAYKCHKLSVLNLSQEEDVIWLWLDFGKTCEAIGKIQEAINCYLHGLQLSFNEPCLYLLEEAYKKLTPLKEIPAWRGYKLLLNRYPDEQKIKDLLDKCESSLEIRKELRVLLETKLNLEELRVIAFDLDIDFENLNQTVKISFVIDLINFCKQRQKIRDLLEVISKTYPHILPSIGL